MGDRPTLSGLSERVRGWEKFQAAHAELLKELKTTVEKIHSGMATAAQVEKLQRQVDDLEQTVQAQGKDVEKVAGLEETIESVGERVTALELDRAHGRGWVAGAFAVAGVVGGAVGFLLSLIVK